VNLKRTLDQLKHQLAILTAKLEHEQAAHESQRKQVQMKESLLSNYRTSIRVLENKVRIHAGATESCSNSLYVLAYFPGKAIESIQSSELHNLHISRIEWISKAHMYSAENEVLSSSSNVSDHFMLTY
jgi:hypothetical protein